MRGEPCEQTQEVEVLADHWNGVQVYLRCQQTMLAGMGGGALVGVSAQEVRAAAIMLRVPSREWPDVIDTAQELAALVARIENEKAQAKAKG